MSRVALVLVVSLFYAHAEFLTKKFCDDVDPSQCMIHNVILDSCEKNQSFCTLRRKKQYTLTADLTPHFASSKLKIAMYSDTTLANTFDKIIKTPADACSVMFCPLEAESRHLFDIDFSFDKTIAPIKFPVKVKLWDEDDEKKACCFTFNVKINK